MKRVLRPGFLSQDDTLGLGFAIPPGRDRDLVARRVAVEYQSELTKRLHRLAVDLRDDIAELACSRVGTPEVRFSGTEAWDHLANQDTRDAQSRDHRSIQPAVGRCNAESGGRVFPVGNQLRYDPQHGIDRHREPETG